MKKESQLAGDVVIARNEGLLTAEVDGELMAMSIDRGTCYGLNGSGTRIWALIAEPCTVDDLCAQLLSEYDVDAEQCRSEVIDLLVELRAEGLITVRGR
jgi:Coenzyme PQQ synthesis protein D (PqqD)